SRPTPATATSNWIFRCSRNHAARTHWPASRLGRHASICRTKTEKSASWANNLRLLKWAECFSLPCSGLDDVHLSIPGEPGKVQKPSLRSCETCYAKGVKTITIRDLRQRWP